MEVLGICYYCKETFTVKQWYDHMSSIGNLTNKIWICPGCGKELITNEIQISYREREVTI